MQHAEHQVLFMAHCPLNCVHSSLLQCVYQQEEYVLFKALKVQFSRHNAFAFIRYSESESLCQNPKVQPHCMQSFLVQKGNPVVTTQYYLPCAKITSLAYNGHLNVLLHTIKLLQYLGLSSRATFASIFPQFLSFYSTTQSLVHVAAKICFKNFIHINVDIF